MIKMKLVVSGSDSNITWKECFEDQFFSGVLEWARDFGTFVPETDLYDAGNVIVCKIRP